MGNMKTIKILVTVAVLAAALTAQTSIETKNWPAGEEALRVKKSGGFISPTFTEWMMDGIWPEDITPQQCADMMTNT
jgi:hypothetical protein